MNTYENLSLFSPLSYGSQHLLEGGKKLISNEPISDKLKAIAEMSLGLFQLVPFVGLVPTLIEKNVKNYSLAGRLKERKLFVKQEIKSHSFLLQKLYFDTTSANRHSHIKIFDDSTPDLQLFSLINDVKHFIKAHESMLTSSEKAKLSKTLGKLKDAKETALIISAIMCSPSISEKKQLQETLKSHLKQRFEKLSIGESLIVPCGYMNGNLYNVKDLFLGDASGHALLLEVQKKSDAVCDAKLFDSAGGSHTKDAAKQNHFYPRCYDNISLSTLISPEFLTDFTAFAENEKLEKNFASSEVVIFFHKYFGSPRAINPALDKAYLDQGARGTCSKKSLQVWLHTELQSINPIYRKFRTFKLQKNLDKVDSFTAKLPLSFYNHSLGRWGFTSSANPVLAIFQKIIGFFTSPRIKIPILGKNVKVLTQDARTILNKKN